jgi:hypothetical protein
MLSHIRRTRLLVGAVVLITTLAVIFRRSSTILVSDTHLTRAKSASQIQQPQHNPGDPPFLHDPPPLVVHDPLDRLYPVPSPPDHAIGQLISEARFNFSRLLGKQPLSLGQAAAGYRERRGRHPPPGFGQWFEAAKKSNAIVVEEFFDRIYDDLAPFWGIEPKEMQWRTRHWPQYIRIRKGKASFVAEGDKYRPRAVDRWLEMMKDMAPDLPDMDLPINVMDEPRILVPFDQMAELVAKERSERRIIHPRETISEYGSYDPGDGGEVPYEPGWIRNKAFLYWNYVTATCPPDAPARAVPALQSTLTAVEYPIGTADYYMHKGYVRNATLARDICYQPHMRSMHGTFQESISISTTPSLLPIFGGAKLPQNSDIILPSGAYLEDDSSILGRWDHGSTWDKKKPMMLWRGAALGGRNKAQSWHHFHRHRFVQMFNGSVIAALEQGNKAASPTFQLLDPTVYGLEMQRDGRLGEWISQVTDVGFTHLQCFPANTYTTKTAFGREQKHVAPTCPYTDPWYRVVTDMGAHATYGHKFLPDIDGNTYSGSWRTLLRSTSMPLKATMYAEWHDNRLVPWVHYVPIDNSYMDVYGVLDYFINHKDGDAHAQRIAEDGRAWAEATFRHEDMKLYLWRVLIEYARVLDKGRHRLAFVDDLVGL